MLNTIKLGLDQWIEYNRVRGRVQGPSSEPNTDTYVCRCDEINYRITLQKKITFEFGDYEREGKKYVVSTNILRIKGILRERRGDKL